MTERKGLEPVLATEEALRHGPAGPLLAAILLGAVAASPLPATARAAGPAQRSPNVVFILSDDQAYTDFGFMGHPVVRTPYIDRLAGQSARYTCGYVPSSVCRPSLATLLTGLYPHEHGVYFNHPPPGFAALGRMTADDYYGARAAAETPFQRLPTLPRILAEHGYRSFQAGKHWEGHYRTAGFTDGMTLGRASDAPAFGNRTLADGSVVAHGNGDAGLVIGRTTMEPIEPFLDACGDGPFLLWYAPFLPHTPHDAPQKYVDLYRDDPRVPEHFVPYYANCTRFDDTVGELVGSIQRRGLARRTIFVLVVDNGWEPKPAAGKRSEYPVNTRSKRSPFELGLRTPILIRWDGHVQPATLDTPVSTVDLVPTLLEAVGLGEEAAGLPGVSMLPSAVGKAPLEKRPIFGEIYPGDATALGRPSGDVAYRWVREGRYKLIVPHLRDGKVWRRYVVKTSLFDVAEDPREEHDLSADPAHAERIERMRRLLDEWWTPG